MKKMVLLLLVCLGIFSSANADTIVYKNAPIGGPKFLTNDKDNCEPQCKSADDKVPAGYECVKCCKKGAQSAQDQPAGTASFAVRSLDVGISTGRNKPGVPLPGGLVRIKAFDPGAVLYSPQSLGYSMGLTIYGVSTNLTTNGTPKRVTILGASCEPVVYEFVDNVVTGRPTGAYSASFNRLVMCNANGAPVVQNPRYYELRLSVGSTYRFGADRQFEDYLGLVSFTTPYGRVGTLQGGGVKIIRDENGIIRQINSPDCLVDVVVSTNIGYQIRFYMGANRGIWNASLGLYDSFGAPFVVNRIEDPDNGANGNRRVKFTQERGQSSKYYMYTYTDAAKEWKLVDGDGLRTETLDSMWDESRVNRIETRTIRGASGNVVALSGHRYRVFPFGERLVEENIYSGGGTNIITAEYYESASETGRYSCVKSESKYDGMWIAYDYDVQGRRTIEVQPWKDTTFGCTSGIRIIRYDYSPVDSNDQGLNTFLARTKTETIDGITNALTYYAFYTNSIGEKVEIEETSPSPSAVYGATASLRKTSIHYAASSVSDAVAGLPKSVTYPNGLMDSYSYEYGYLRVPSSGRYDGSECLPCKVLS